MNNFEFAGKLNDLRKKAQKMAHDAKLAKPTVKYGIRNWPVREQPFDPENVPGVMIGGYNAAKSRWEPLVHCWAEHVHLLKQVLEIDGKVPSQDNWEEVNAAGELEPKIG